MGKFSDTDFDLKIREILDGAEEEVPAHVWDAVETRLDRLESSRARRVIPVWLRNTGFISAAAAAVVFALVLTGTFDSNAPADMDSMIAVVESPAIPEETASDEERALNVTELLTQNSGKGGSTGHDSIMEKMTYIAETGNETAGETEQENEEKSVTRPSELPSSRSSISGNAQTGRWVDPLAFEDEPKTMTRVSVTLNGNASGSSSSGTSAAPVARPLKAGSATQRPVRQTINETGSSTYSIPLSFGAGAKVALSPRWSIGAGVNYTLLTRSFKGTYIDESKIPVEYAKIRNSQSYIGIPVNAYFSIISNRKIDFYAYAGGTAEKCVSNRYRMAPEVIYKEKVKGFQFSADAGIGVEFIFADMIGLYIDPNIRYYFKGKNQPKSIRTENPLAFGCEIGLRVRL